MFRIPMPVMKKAFRLLAKHTRKWPEDEWFTIGEHYDLNICSNFVQGVELRFACVYYVDDEGKIRTDDWVRIVEFIPVEDQYVENIVVGRIGLPEEYQ